MHLIATSKHRDEQLSLELKKQIDAYGLYTDVYRVYEAWEQRERQSKFIANTNRYYEALRIGWSMPFWDFRFVKFWDQVPLEYKRGRRLYREFLENNIFKQVGVNFLSKEKKKPSFIKKQLSFLKKVHTLNRLIALYKDQRPLDDEYGLYLSLPYLYDIVKYNCHVGFDLMSHYCETLEFEEPRKQYEYLARAVLAMILEESA
jgi:hypothetical protein